MKCVRSGIPTFSMPNVNAEWRMPANQALH